MPRRFIKNIDEFKPGAAYRFKNLFSDAGIATMQFDEVSDITIENESIITFLYSEPLSHQFKHYKLFCLYNNTVIYILSAFPTGKHEGYRFQKLCG
jgi:hypothetical protein